MSTLCTPDARMHTHTSSGSFVPSPRENTGRCPAEHPGGSAAVARSSHLLKVGLLAIACAWGAGCGSHVAPVTTAPVAVPDADADASVDVSELGATSNTPHAGGSALGGPLAGIDGGLLARFDAGRD